MYLIISTAYKSSLISHLVVQGKSSVINSMEELAERGETDGWAWGIPGFLMTSAHKTFFVTSPSPAIIKVHKDIKVRDKDCVEVLVFHKIKLQYCYHYQEKCNSCLIVVPAVYRFVIYDKSRH